MIIFIGKVKIELPGINLSYIHKKKGEQEMKKILSALLTATMLFGTLLPVTFAADSWVENPDISGADLKFGMIGDSHVTSDSSILSWFQESLTAQKTIGGGTLDALALTGDVIYQNNSDEVITDR